MEPLFFNNLRLALDRYFVHRLRAVTGKDSNSVNEVEMLAGSLMTNNGVLQRSNVIKYMPELSVTTLKIGEPIRLSADDFERLSRQFVADTVLKFV